MRCRTSERWVVNLVMWGVERRASDKEVPRMVLCPTRGIVSMIRGHRQIQMIESADILPLDDIYQLKLILKRSLMNKPLRKTERNT